MADEKKTVKKEDTSKAEKKTNPVKKVGGFFAKIGKAIAKFFKDLKGETKKIVWPGRQMVLKSTGIVLAVILVIGAGIWIIDYAVSGAVTALGNAASVEETVEETEESEETSEESTEEDEDEETTESTTEA